MPEAEPHRWKFLTNHAQVLACIAHDPGVLLREISERVGITERAAHRIVSELADGGYITRERDGRRNKYTIQSGLPLPDRLGRVQRISDLLTILIGSSEEPERPAEPQASARRPIARAGGSVSADRVT
jgi:DNA-binding Lrp family transcriptional regulator